MSTPVVIAVDGIDGSGKSVFGERLRGALVDAGIHPLLFRIDDFRQKLDWQKPEKREHDRYYDDYYGLESVAACVDAACLSSDAIEVPVWDASAETSGPPKVWSAREIGAVIIEGVFTLRIPAVAASGFVVYLKVSEAEARRRILARDLARGRTEAEVIRRIEQRYFPAQRRYLAECAPLARADIVIDNEDFEHPRLARHDLARLAPNLRQAITRVLPGPGS